MQKMQIQSLGWEDSLEEEVATHSSVLAWEIPWMGILGGYSPWGRKELDMTEWLNNKARVSAKDEWPLCLVVVTLGTVPHLAPYGIFQARILEWVAISFSKWVFDWPFTFAK